MAKNSFQDITKVKKTPPVVEYSVEVEKNYKSLWFVAAFSIVFLFFAISFIFASAKVSVFPKIKKILINQDFSAIKNSNNSADLSFDLIVLSGDDSKNIQAGEEKDYLEKAKGIVILYNNFSKNSQKFSANTKLEGMNGLIYKIDKAVVVPGQNIDGTPGSIEVSISAEKEGAEYNSDPIDFKIVGFKGTAKYEKFFGRSKDKIEGGLKGRSRQAKEEDKQKAIAELSDSLKVKLYEKAINQIPNGYLLFKDAVILKVDENDSMQATEDGQVKIKIKGTLYGYILNENKLTNNIVKAAIPDFDNSDVYIPDIKNLTFSLNNKDSMSSFDVLDLSFNISGSANVFWKFDSSNLAKELMGKDKKDFDQVLSLYPNISTAEMSISPIWKSSFPSKSKDIEINVKYENNP